MEVVESEEDLFRDLLDEREGEPADVVVILDQSEQTLAENLEHHADMRPVGGGVAEGVEEFDDVATSRVRIVRGGGRSGRNSFEKLDLVESGLSVVLVGLDNLESDVTVLSEERKNEGAEGKTKEEESQRA